MFEVSGYDLLTMRSLRSLAQVCDTTVDEPRLRRTPCYHLETLCWWCVITVCSFCSQADGSLLVVLGSALDSELGELLELQRQLWLLAPAALADGAVLDSASWLGPPGGRGVVCHHSGTVGTSMEATLMCGAL